MQGGFAGWAVGIVERLGAPGVGVLIALETLLPPVPSEVVLPFAGFSAARGTFSPLAAWAAATTGSLVGAYLLYAVGALVGSERLHVLAGKRWVPAVQLGRPRARRAVLRSAGGKVVLLGRLTPFVRSVVSVPAGATRMPLVRFTALTVAGSGVWNAAFLALGYTLGERWEQARQYAQPLAYAVLVAAVLGVVLLVVRRSRPR